VEIRSYRDLEVWQKAVALTVRCYELTALFPKTERFGLTSQLQRSAVKSFGTVQRAEARFDARQILEVGDGSIKCDQPFEHGVRGIEPTR